MWRNGSPTAPEETPDVLAECAQFLDGQFLEGFGGDRESAPDWVGVSVLAHASEEQLLACAALGDRTLSLLSGALLDHARSTAVPVSLLQHDIVLPIELGLGARPLAATTFVRLVRSGLNARAGLAPDRPASATERRN